MLTTRQCTSDHPIAEHIKKHGDGVKVLALWVNDAYDAFEQTVKRGATPYQQPQTISDEHGEVRTSGICLYGETVHLIHRT